MKTEISFSHMWALLKKSFSLNTKPASYHLMVIFSYFFLVVGTILHQKWMKEAYLPFTEFIQNQAAELWSTYEFPERTYAYIWILLLFSGINVFFMLYTFSSLVKQKKAGLLEANGIPDGFVVQKTNLFLLCLKKMPMAMLYMLLANLVAFFSLYFSDLLQLIFELFYSFVLLFVLEGQKFTFSFGLSRHFSLRNRSFYFFLLTIFYILDKMLLYALVSVGHISWLWLTLLLGITYLKYAKLSFLSFYFSSFFSVVKMDKNDLFSEQES